MASKKNVILYGMSSLVIVYSFYDLFAPVPECTGGNKYLSVMYYITTMSFASIIALQNITKKDLRSWLFGVYLASFSYRIIVELLCLSADNYYVYIQISNKIASSITLALIVISLIIIGLCSKK